ERDRGPDPSRRDDPGPVRCRSALVAPVEEWSGGEQKVSPVAVVTGAARGIGAATVDRLVAEDWRVVAVDVCANDPALEYPLATAGDLDDLRRRHGPKVHTMVGDVRSQTDMDAAVAAAVTEFGGLTAAVGVAGVLSGGPPLWEISDERWNVQFDVNVGDIRHLATA